PYEDLDEIIARYIQPMAGFARDIMTYKYYMDGVYSEDTPTIEAHLVSEKQRTPSKIPYTLTASQKYPAKFVLSYLAQQKVRHEYLSATPEGIKFRYQMFNSTEELINWFKLHYMHRPEVYKKKNQCELSCRTSDLRKSYVSEKNNRFDEQRCKKDKEQKEKERSAKTAKNHFVKMVISHPSFHNVTFKDAERILREMDPGDAIVRPSGSSAKQVIFDPRKHSAVDWVDSKQFRYAYDLISEEGKKNEPGCLQNYLMPLHIHKMIISFTVSCFYLLLNAFILLSEVTLKSTNLENWFPKNLFISL
uniref:Spt6 SH2 domain-containing protein n=1 Tax=Ditylenchus dipsaci TaxID=166011 RepID=A0A915EFB5_9BILA